MSVVEDSLQTDPTSVFSQNQIIKQYNHTPVRSRSGRLYNLQSKSSYSSGGGSSVIWRTFPLIEGVGDFGNVCTFRLLENYILRNVSIKLKLKQLVKDASGSYICYVPAHYFFQQIEILGNNGSVELQRIFPEDQYLFFRATTKSTKMEAREAAMGASLAVQNRIEDNTNNDMEYYVELYGLLKQIDLALGKLKSELRIRITFNDLVKCVESDSVNKAFSGGGISACEMVCEFQDLSPPLYKALMDNSSVRHYRHLIPDRVFLSVPTGTTSMNEILTAFNGVYPFLLFYLTKPNASGSDMYKDFRPIKNFELQNSDGLNLTYRTQITPAQVKYLFGDEFWSDKNENSFIIEMDNLMFFSWSDDPADDWKNGTSHGHYKFTSRERLIINFEEPTTEDLQVVLLGYRHQLIQLSPNGLLSVIR